MLTVNNKDTRTTFIVNAERISRLDLVLLLLTCVKLTIVNL